MILAVLASLEAKTCFIYHNSHPLIRIFQHISFGLKTGAVVYCSEATVCNIITFSIMCQRITAVLIMSSFDFTFIVV